MLISTSLSNPSEKFLDKHCPSADVIAQVAQQNKLNELMAMMDVRNQENVFVIDFATRQTFTLDFFIDFDASKNPWYYIFLVFSLSNVLIEFGKRLKKGLTLVSRPWTVLGVSLRIFIS